MSEARAGRDQGAQGSASLRRGPGGAGRDLGSDRRPHPDRRPDGTFYLPTALRLFCSHDKESFGEKTAFPPLPPWGRNCYPSSNPETFILLLSQSLRVPPGKWLLEVSCHVSHGAGGGSGCRVPPPRTLPSDPQQTRTPLQPAVTPQLACLGVQVRPHPCLKVPCRGQRAGRLPPRGHPPNLAGSATLGQGAHAPVPE